MKTRIRFTSGTHVLDIFGHDRRWVVALDGVLLRGWFDSTSRAWTAGVAEAARVDQFPGAALPEGDAGARRAAS
jgi:hypothetical protein